MCTCIGYVDASQPVNGRGVINFNLAVDAQLLDETVVVGYGTLKKSQLVGSVEQLAGDVLEDRVNADVTRSLQGQVPGLSIFQSDGKPTHGGSIYIRGGATNYVMKKNMSSKDMTEYSIGQGGSALVLIDGVEGELSSVNPDDIESVTVLKDASSASIYGSRAAYGVILVTTKRSASDKITISYNGSISLNRRTVMWEDHVITDGLEYTQTFYDFWVGRTETPTAAGSLPTKMNIYDIPSDYLQRFQERRAAGNTSVYDTWDKGHLYFGSVNYLAEFYKRMNTTQTHSLSVNGSSKKMSYSLSGRYYTQDGIYKIGQEDYNQFNLRSKVSLQLRDWLSVDNNTYFYHYNYASSGLRATGAERPRARPYFTGCPYHCRSGCLGKYPRGAYCPSHPIAQSGPQILALNDIPFSPLRSFYHDRAFMPSVCQGCAKRQKSPRKECLRHAVLRCGHHSQYPSVCR